MNDNPNVAIVGATGAVGVEMIRTIEKRSFPIGKLKLLASARSAGKKLAYKGESIEIEALTEQSFDDVDIALFSAGGGISQQFAPHAVQSNAVVIDNSSAFRMEADVPLVVPEINPEDAKQHSGIIANPNCSTIITLMALNPLHQAFGVKRVIASTYQAVSGSGAQAITELDNQVDQLRGAKEVTKEVYPHQIAFNVLPHVDVFLDGGYTKEEMKLENESRKILHLPDLRASATCVRVPVYRSHSIAANAEFEKPVSVEDARRAIESAPGVYLMDEPANNRYPTPLHTSETDDCAVGRIRLDCALDNGLAFWVCGDQLLKGAALNAVQIAELLLP